MPPSNFIMKHIWSKKCPQTDKDKKPDDSSYGPGLAVSPPPLSGDYTMDHLFASAGCQISALQEIPDPQFLLLVS